MFSGLVRGQDGAATCDEGFLRIEACILEGRSYPLLQGAPREGPTAREGSVGKGGEHGGEGCVEFIERIVVSIMKKQSPWWRVIAS